MQPPEPAPEHRWLTRLLGDWTWESEEVPGVPFPYQKTEGRETFRAIGDLWVQGDGHGGYGTSQMTLGFDPRTGRFVGAWIGTMMPHLWVYDGVLDAGKTRLALYSQGPSFSGDGTLAPYCDEIEIVSENERCLRASVQNPDGSWMHFMTTRYRRA
jgi:hypothetical protein